MSTTSGDHSTVRYQADERPPPVLVWGLGIQLAILCIAGIVLTPAIVIKAAGGSSAYLAWAVFGAVLVSGVTTILQAVRIGRVGAGYVLLMGTSGAFIAVSVTAVSQGGPALLATLVILSSLLQFLFAGRLALFRRLLTPTVTGTVIMLIPVTVMPIIFDMFASVPEGTHGAAAPVSAAVTFAFIAGISLRARGVLRLWAPVVGVIAGAITGALFGIYDTAAIADARWIGLPAVMWPGFDLDFGPAFWALFPAIVLVTFVGAIETVSDSVAIQRVSWRHPRAVDFRAVQGAVTCDGVGNLLSGLIGTVPNTTYSTSISVTELTGVAARGVGVAIGIIFILCAFFPKGLALVLAIPEPVAAAYITVLLAMLFVIGIRIVVHDDFDYRKGLIVGISFWVGIGFQNGLIFPELAADFAGGLLQNGMTAGGLCALLLSMFRTLTVSRRSRIETGLDVASLPDLRHFVAEFSRRSGWGSDMVHRLEVAVEETMLSLTEVGAEGPRRLRLAAYREDEDAVLEFVACPGDANLEDRVAVLGETLADTGEMNDMSLRLLRHISSSIRHQQYHDVDVVTVRVDRPAPAPGQA